MSDYAVGFMVDLGSPGLKFISRTGFAGRAPAEDYPLSNRVDEIESLVVFDDVEIPWENVLFYQHTKAASYIRRRCIDTARSRLCNALCTSPTC